MVIFEEQLREPGAVSKAVEIGPAGARITMSGLARSTVAIERQVGRANAPRYERCGSPYIRSDSFDWVPGHGGTDRLRFRLLDHGDEVVTVTVEVA